LGGLATLVGLLTQAAAAGFILVMLGAIRLKVLQMHKGFTGEGGWEFESCSSSEQSHCCFSVRESSRSTACCSGSRRADRRVC